MQQIKFRFRLKLLEESFGKYKKGDIDFFYMTLQSLIRYPIDFRWEIISCDRFIGHKDKNGDAIYEGDITRFRNLKYDGKNHVDSEYTSVVKWNDNKIGFYIDGMVYKYYKYYDGNEQDEEESIETSEMEIIGNIYKNPELCEK